MRRHTPNSPADNSRDGDYTLNSDESVVTTMRFMPGQWEQGATFSAHHGDRIGTSRVMTDSNAGALRRAVYTAFGELVTEDGAAATRMQSAISPGLPHRAPHAPTPHQRFSPPSAVLQHSFLRFGVSAFTPPAERRQTSMSEISRGALLPHQTQNEAARRSCAFAATRRPRRSRAAAIDATGGIAAPEHEVFPACQWAMEDADDLSIQIETRPSSSQRVPAKK